LITKEFDKSVLKIEYGNLSIREAGKVVSIPFSTLQTHLQNLKNKVVRKSVGQPLSIPEMEEK
jgi:hypothetical protein